MGILKLRNELITLYRSILILVFAAVNLSNSSNDVSCKLTKNAILFTKNKTLVHTKGCYIYKSYSRKDKKTFYDIIKLGANGDAYSFTLFSKNINNKEITGCTASSWKYIVDSNVLILSMDRMYKCIHVKHWDYYKIKKDRIRSYKSVSDYEVTRKVFEGKNADKGTYTYCDTLTAMPMIE